MAVFGEAAGCGGFEAVHGDPLEGGSTLKQNQMILLVLK